MKCGFLWIALLIFLCLLCSDSSVEIYDLRACKGKEWKGILKEWLNLFRLMRNPGSFYQSKFFRDILQYRLVEAGNLIFSFAGI